MIPIKIQCSCGQRYAFDAEVADGCVTHQVLCPACGTDGTAAANTYVAQTQRAIPVATPIASGPRLATHSNPNRPSAEVLANLPPVNREQVDHEARAKVFWGDEPDSVVKYMMMQGVPYNEANAVVEGFVSERKRVTRANGIRKILLGSPLVCVPIVAFFIFAGMGYFPIKLFAFTVLVGVYGGWIVLKGTMLLAAPGMEPGDVADQ